MKATFVEIPGINLWRSVKICLSFCLALRMTLVYSLPICFCVKAIFGETKVSPQTYAPSFFDAVGPITSTIGVLV